MRQFAFKNLTVNVGKVAGAQLCLNTMPTCAVACSAIAVGPSQIRCRVGNSFIDNGCGRFISVITDPGGGGCGVNFSTLPPTDWLRDVIRTAVDPTELTVLRDELDLAVAELDARAEVVNAAFAPQTVADAELVEGHLVEALDEVRDLKGRLEG